MLDTHPFISSVAAHSFLLSYHWWELPWVIPVVERRAKHIRSLCSHVHRKWNLLLFEPPAARLGALLKPLTIVCHVGTWKYYVVSFANQTVTLYHVHLILLLHLCCIGLCLDLPYALCVYGQHIVLFLADESECCSSWRIWHCCC